MYTGFTPAVALGIEPSLAWNNAGASLVNAVSIRDVTAAHLVLATQSASGAFFCLADDSATGTKYGKLDAATAALCVGGW